MSSIQFPLSSKNQTGRGLINPTSDLPSFAVKLLSHSDSPKRNVSCRPNSATPPPTAAPGSVRLPGQQYAQFGWQPPDSQTPAPTTPPSPPPTQPSRWLTETSAPRRAA